jgi:hypothetical protein
MNGTYTDMLLFSPFKHDSAEEENIKHRNSIRAGEGRGGD